MFLKNPRHVGELKLSHLLEVCGNLYFEEYYNLYLGNFKCYRSMYFSKKVNKIILIRYMRTGLPPTILAASMYLPPTKISALKNNQLGIVATRQSKTKISRPVFSVKKKV